MTNGPSFKTYAQLPEKEQQYFNRWLNANVVLSSLMGAGLFASAIMGYVGVGGTEQIAKAKPAETTASTNEPARATPTPLPPAEFIVPVVDRR